MKKFLSVLLALAVAFTFTFGSTMSAFADETTTTVEQQIAKAAADAQTEVEKDLDAFLGAIVYDQAGYVFSAAGTADENYKLLNKDAVAKGAAQFKADVVKELSDESRNQTLEGKYNADAFAQYNDYVTAAKVFNATAYVAMFDTAKANALAEVAKVNASEYLTYDYISPEDNNDESDSAMVAAAVKAANDAINAVKAPKVEDGVDAAVAAIEAVLAVKVDVSKYTKAADYEKQLTEAKAAANKAVADAAKAAEEQAVKDYEAALAKATTPADKTAAETAYNYAKTGIPTVANQLYATITDTVIDKDTKPEKALEVVNQVKTDAATAFTADNIKAVMDQLANIDGLVAYAKTVAAEKKAALNKDGTIIYDAAVVEKRLDEVLKGINNGTYKNFTAVYSAFDGMTTIANTAEKLVAAKKAALKTIEAKYNKDDYAEAEQVKLADLQKEAKDAVADAATEDAVAQILKDLDAAVKALATKEQTAALADAANGVITTLKYDAALDNLYTATVLVAPENTYPTNGKAAVLDAAKKVMVDAVLAGIDAAKPYKTEDVEAIVKANYDAAKAVVTGMATSKQIEALVADAIAKIDAIPSVVTIADKATVEAAREAVDALKDVPGYDGSLDQKKLKNLKDAEATIKNLEAKAVTDAVKALTDKVTAKTISAADEDAYTAAKEAADAFAKKYSAPAAQGIDLDLVTIKAAIDDVKYSDAAKALNAIPETVTLEDKATVEAARKAFDALSKAQQDTLAKSLKDKLAAAEATIAELEKYTVTNVKADLLDMSRKITIWRTSKSSIRVTATGSVANITDHGYTVEYKFYKKAPGAKSYKLVKTTSSNKYTYTNLKKGTNKFQVKVVVKDADGNVVASKMTYYRAAKIK